MQIHRLKTWPPYFNRVEEGQKTFEVRKNDRDFQVGDHVFLEYYNPNPPADGIYCSQTPTILKQITYVLHGGQFGIEQGYCVFGLADVEPEGV